MGSAAVCVGGGADTSRREGTGDVPLRQSTTKAEVNKTSSQVAIVTGSLAAQLACCYM